MCKADQTHICLCKADQHPPYTTVLSTALLDTKTTDKSRILKPHFLNSFGSPQEIVELFGGKEQYLQTLTELKQEIYKEVA